METSTAVSANKSKNDGKVLMCITILHKFCLNECCFLANNADEIQDNGHGYIPSDISVTNNEGNSVPRGIIFDELAQRALERPFFISLH